MLIQVSGINIYRVTTICHLAYFNVTRGLQCEAIAAESQERNARLNDQLIDTRVDIIRNAIVLNVRFLSRKSVVCSTAFGGHHPTNSRDNVKFRASCGTHAFSHGSVRHPGFRERKPAQWLEHRIARKRAPKNA